MLTSLFSTCRLYRNRQKSAGHDFLLDSLLGIFYMHFHRDMIIYDTAFGEPVGGTGRTRQCYPVQ